MARNKLNTEQIKYIIQILQRDYHIDIAIALDMVRKGTYRLLLTDKQIKIIKSLTIYLIVI